MERAENRLQLRRRRATEAEVMPECFCLRVVVLYNVIQSHPSHPSIMSWLETTRSSRYRHFSDLPELGSPDTTSDLKFPHCPRIHDLNHAPAASG